MFHSHQPPVVWYEASFNFILAVKSDHQLLVIGNPTRQ
jgi:hypothetical protein